MWAFEKSNSDKSSTTISLSLNSTFLPFDFDDASKYKLSIGKSLCSNIWTISVPTAPVAPATAMLYFWVF